MSRAAPPRIAVIGAGITGLAAAHRLIELSRAQGRTIELQVFEAGARPGGVIRTEHADGFLLEAGPDSFLTEKPAGTALCERLGIADQLVGTNEAFRRTYVVRHGRLVPLPDGFLLLAPTRLWPLLTTPLFSWRGKLRMALDLVLPRGAGADESLADFVTRRLGREVLDRVAEPLVGGIYTADPAHLSVAATLPRFRDMERADRSIALALWRQRRNAARGETAAVSGARWSLFVSFARGMQVLVDALAGELPPGALRCGERIEAVARAGGVWHLGAGHVFDALLIATPAYVAAQLLRTSDAALATELEGIGYASSAIVTLAYGREDVPHPLDGFGFVVPHGEGRALLACTFSSLKYPGRAPAHSVLLRAFVGGALRAHTAELADDELVGTVQRELSELLGVRQPAQLVRIARWHRSMPQYEMGHLDRVARIRARSAALGVHVAGSAFEGVGIPDCIRSGETQAELLLSQLPAV
ncbi:MAG: protoporphyrinogen oxidase [Candidatus Binatia bacterium]